MLTPRHLRIVPSVERDRASAVNLFVNLDSLNRLLELFSYHCEVVIVHVIIYADP